MSTEQEQQHIESVEAKQEQGAASIEVQVEQLRNQIATLQQQVQEEFSQESVAEIFSAIEDAKLPNDKKQELHQELQNIAQDSEELQTALNGIENTKAAAEQYEKEILPMLESLRPDDVEMQDFEESVVNELFESVKKQQVAEGALVKDPKETMQEVKDMLTSRINTILDKAHNEYQEKDENKLDAGLIRRAKIAALRMGDYSDLQKYSREDGVPSADSVIHYLERNRGSRKITGRELAELESSRVADSLSKTSYYNLDKYLGDVPEKMFLRMIDTQNDYGVKHLLENHSPKTKYSNEVVRSLLKNKYGHLVLKYFESFSEIEFEDAIKVATFMYPYKFQDIVEKLRSLNLPKEEFDEKFNYALTHQKISYGSDMEVPELKERYQESLDKVNSIPRRIHEDITPEDLVVPKQLIEDGQLGLLHDLHFHVKKIAEDDYEWLMKHVRRYDQEHLLMSSDLLTPEDQLSYVKEIIEEGNEFLIDSIVTGSPYHGSLVDQHVLSEEVFKRLGDLGYNPVSFLKKFKGLSQDVFENLYKEGYFEKHKVSEYIGCFKFETGSRASIIFDETQGMSDGLMEYYVDKFFQSGTLEERQEFIKSHFDNVAKAADNKVLTLEDPVQYELVCKEVYPGRNYDTYKHIQQYEDRSRDLEEYTFDREGYEIKIDGVLGYKVKDGEQLDNSVIIEFSKRVEEVKSISNTETLFNFLDDNINESQAETIEGKILEYFHQNGYTLDTMNVLLAYQLQGQYDEFVAESTDRASAAEDQNTKNYILLDELANKYGDTMKEVIKAVQEKVANSSDKELFVNDVKEEYGEKYNKVANSILDSLGKIPADKLTNQIIQKKIEKTIVNTFQSVKDLQERAGYFAQLFTVNDMGNFTEVWNRHMDQLFVVSDEHAIDMKKIQGLQSAVYQKIQGEASKYQEIRETDEDRGGEVKGSKERVIKGYFSKNKENAHARMVGDICLASDQNMLKNENYFEFVLFDQEKKKCVGTTMLLNMEEPDGKKYLLYCPNPSVGLVSEVSAKKLYKAMTDQVSEFAEDNDFDGVLVKKTHGHATNRAGLFQNSLEQSCLKDEKGSDRTISLSEEHTLGGGYKYKDDLQIVWEK